MEFYTSIAESLKKEKGGYLWRTDMPDNALFPAAINNKELSAAEAKRICELFRLAGAFVAKNIVDDRLIDLPISPLMWQIMLGKKMNLFDLKDLHTGLFNALSELQVMANRKKEIDEMNLDPEARQRLLS